MCSSTLLPVGLSVNCPKLVQSFSCYAPLPTRTRSCEGRSMACVRGAGEVRKANRIAGRRHFSSFIVSRFIGSLQARCFEGA